MTEEKRRRATLIHARLPCVEEETIRQADGFLRGEHILPGTGAKPLFAGDPVAWTENRAGDNEYIWQLNRMTHWQQLLQAYALTGEEKYAKKVLAELAHWVSACPPPEVPRDRNRLGEVFSGVHPWRILEVGIRAYKTFPLIVEYLAGDPLFDDALQAVYRETMLTHARLLEEVSPILWPDADHNHYLMEMLGLLSVAVLFPEEPAAVRWRELAVHELERCSAAQLTAEGGQIEGCPMYHNGCMFWFGHSLVMAERYGLPLSTEYRARYRRALDYCILSLRPDGHVMTWGDSTAKNNAVLGAVYGYAVFRDVKWFRALLRFSDREAVLTAAGEFLWRIPDLAGLLDCLDTPDGGGELALPVLSWQKSLKQVFLRSGWGRDDAAVLFACRTPIQNFHAHIDPMGFDFSALGKPLVVDPGIVTYQDNQTRYDLKSAAYHNTLTVNGRDHFEYTKSFGFGPQKFGTVYDAGEAGGFRWAAAMHAEFCPAVHRRLVGLYEDKFLLVLDAVDGLKHSDSVQLWFHINSETAAWENGFCRTRDAGANAAVFPTAGLEPSVHDGIVGELVDVFHPSKRLRLENRSGAERRQFASVIVPFRSGEAPSCEGLTFDSGECAFSLGGTKYRFRWNAEGVTGGVVS